MVNRRLLDIVVTHYNEPWSVVRPFFDVLCSQKSCNFDWLKVWFIQDGPAERVFPDGYFNGAPIGPEKGNFETVAIHHKGVSAARNKGLEVADAKWIMFCDCDDCFASVYALKFILSVLDTEDYDLMWSPFYSNLLGLGDPLIKMEDFNSIWIHNKFYRLDFLRKIGLKFCEDLYMSEDSAFNQILQLELGEGRIGQINVAEPFYCWCRRLGSVTTDPDKRLLNARGHFLRNLYMLGEYRKRNLEMSKLVVVRTVTDVYSMVTKWNKDGAMSAEGIAALEKETADFYRENKDIYDSVSDADVVKCLAASERETGDVYVERPTLEEWLVSILSGFAITETTHEDNSFGSASRKKHGS